MEKAMFKLLQETENSWWYRGRTLIVRTLLARFKVRAERALDYGAGFGGMRQLLSAVSARVYAFEPDPGARRATETRGYHAVFDTPDSALSMPWDLVAMFDVLEHIEDDSAFLKTLHSSIQNGGKLVVTVPAYQWLWSEHDRANMHYRRYTKGSLAEVLARSGYRIDYVGYWNTLLFLPAACVRLMGNSGGDALRVGPIVNTVLYTVVLLESLVVRFTALPFGLSVVAIASKS